MLEPTRYLAAIENDGAGLAVAARKDLDAPVPSCPEWAMRDLVEHTGEVHRFWTKIAIGIGDPQDVVRETPPAPDLVVEWYSEGLDRLLGTLRDADLNAPIWTWAPGDHTTSWIFRRMAQETAVHRWDAENAVAHPRPIDADVGSDGIDELLYVWLPASRELHRGAGETVHLHCTDVDGEWLVRLTAGSFEVTREHAKGDTAMRASASDLLLAFWERIPLERIEVLGPPEHARSLLAAVDRT
jgi:uncharacterized protein (TIGR03083 family)